MPQPLSDISDLLAHWRKEGVKLSDPCDPLALTAIESLTSTRLPAEFCALYSMIDGMMDWDADEILFTLWPLPIIYQEAREPESPWAPNRARLLHFADFLMDSNRFGIVLDGPEAGSIALDCRGKHQTVAPSFAEFVTLLLNAPHELSMFERARAEA